MPSAPAWASECPSRAEASMRLGPFVRMERVFSPGIAATRPLWLRSPKTQTRPSGQLGRDGMVDAGLVGGDAWITIRRESPEDVGFREIFVSLDGEQVAI